MNGRIYDPLLGRFMQGDPFIQDPSNLQNFNRYGYCYNNPMTCTDPTGQIFGWDDFLIAIIAIWSAEKVGIIDARTALLFTSIAFAAAMPLPQNMFQAAETGFLSGAISTGNVKGALQGAFTAGMFYGAGNLVGGGNFFTGVGENAIPLQTGTGIMLHGVVGCVTSFVGGGKCGPGALSAAFTKAVASTDYMKGLQDSGDKLTGTVISSVVGGTASVLGGGKFGNGAQTGAFSYLMNDWGKHDDVSYGAGPSLYKLQSPMYQEFNLPSINDQCVQSCLNNNYGYLGGFLINMVNLQQYVPSANPEYLTSIGEALNVANENY